MASQPDPGAAAGGQPGDRLPGPGRCEHRQPNEDQCGAEAPYIVSVGQRRHDAQKCCESHLAASVDALEGAEGRDAEITVRGSAAVLRVLAEAASDRDRFREQARILSEQKAEWLCEACNVIHPWRDGDRFTAACPDCEWPMVPTSASLRSRQVLAQRAEAAEARLAEIATLCRNPAGFVGQVMGAGRVVPGDRLAARILAIIGSEEEGHG